MPRVTVRTHAAGRVVLRHFSLAALLVPALGALVLPAALADYEALLWLTAAIPVLVLGQRRGWEGVGIALGVTVAVMGVTYAAAAALSQTLPALLPGVGVALVGVTLGIGWLAEGGPRRGTEPGPDEDLIDPLTSLPTRAQAELFLDKEFDAARLGRPLVLVAFDLDQFGEFNRRHGWAAGNGVLKAFATLLRQNTRRMNLSARWGPEEFIAVICGSSQEGALVFADRVLELLRAASETTPVPTVSAGVACYRPNMSGPVELVAAAQEALQIAKADGRDRIRVYGATIRPETEARPARRAVADAIDVPPQTTRPERIGIGRSAFVFTADGGLRALLVRYLADQGFRVVEGIWPADGVLPLKDDYDLVLADVGGSGPAWADLVEEIRRRSPATRLIGLPRFEGGLVPPSALTVRVDAYCLLEENVPAFHPELPELLRDRDRQLDAIVRERHLSGEVRAKEREGRVALEESEARYSAVVQRIREVIFETDRDGRITFLNPAWSTITGVSTEDSIGREMVEYVSEVDRAQARLDHDELAAGKRPYMRREVRLATAGGGVRWVEVRAQTARNFGGEIVGVSGLISDVNERKEAAEALRRSEEYFRSLIENSADVMSVLDDKGRLRYSSPALERILGFTAEERTGRAVLELIHKADVEEARTVLGRVLEKPDELDFTELRVLHKDGSWRWLEVTARNLLHVPSVRGVVINARDVTDRKAAEGALRESQEHLYLAQKMDAIGRLAGGVAHDFNNLLTAVQASAESLLTTLPAESHARTEAAAIRDAVGRAISLTRQLLAFSGQQVMQPKVVDLNDVVQPMRKMLDRLAGDAIDVTMKLSAQHWHATVDPQQVEQVILNLAVNGRDAMPAGGALRIAVSETTLAAPIAAHGEEVPAGDYVVLTVADSGQGVPAELRERVFDPFFTTKPASAPGLGLSTVYGIVKQSDGYIRVDSVTREGSDDNAEAIATGTTFTIYLPATAEQAHPEPVRLPEPKPAGGSETIALVEDEKAVRELAQRILRNKGYTVVSAENGRHAIDIIGRFPERIDLLVTDVVMPEMNGRDLADRIAVMRPGVKVLFMSGYTEDAILHHGVLADGTAFLQKPFSPDGLVGAVREVLDTPQRPRKPARSQRPPGPPASHQSAP